SFKSGPRTAYRMLAYGIVLLSLAMLQLPILGLFDLWNTFWATSGAAIVPFVVAALLIYAGLRRLAFEMQIHGRHTSFWLACSLAVVIAIPTGIVAHFWALYKAKGIDVYCGVVAFGTVFMIMTVSLAQIVTNSIGAAYQRAMRGLVITLGMLTFGGLHEVVTTMLFSSTSIFENYGVYLWPFIATGMLFLRPGYEFHQLVMVPAEQMPAAVTREPDDGEYITSITVIADLASRPEAIEPVLEELREFTAWKHAGEALLPADKQRLLTIYTKLEGYLLYSDPLRAFTTDEIRAKLSPSFRTMLEYRGVNLPTTPAAPQKPAQPAPQVAQ
ncbi:MAG TPA: hypothetical protein VKQ34_00995, partial [Candidatus Saccharimonadales bacterium]|nr:hypothetical protein [Candidatus Saccharimonadales bacterium]